MAFACGSILLLEGPARWQEYQKDQVPARTVTTNYTIVEIQRDNFGYTVYYRDPAKPKHEGFSLFPQPKRSSPKAVSRFRPINVTYIDEGPSTISIKRVLNRQGETLWEEDSFFIAPDEPVYSYPENGHARIEGEFFGRESPTKRYEICCAQPRAAFSWIFPVSHPFPHLDKFHVFC
jgi:hypothetical protein